MYINIISACDQNGSIGTDDNTLPWKYMKEDMDYFRKMTFGGVLLMGRKTFESMGSRPLPGRVNIVLTSSSDALDGVLTVSSIDEALSIAGRRGIWVIGGGTIYRQCLEDKYVSFVNEIHLTIIDKVYSGCAVKFPIDAIGKRFNLKSQRSIYNKKNDATCQFYVFANTCRSF